MWAGRLDACSRRVLADALRTAAHPDPLRHAACPDPCARLPVFAALARRLFRHAVHTLSPHPGNRRRRPRAAYPARHRPSHALAAEPGIKAPPLFAALGTYLEPALQPHVSRAAVRAFILETRRELDDLAARPTPGVYLETLAITEPGDNTVTLEVAAALGAAAP